MLPASTTGSARGLIRVPAPPPEMTCPWAALKGGTFEGGTVTQGDAMGAFTDALLPVCGTAVSARTCRCTASAPWAGSLKELEAQLLEAVAAARAGASLGKDRQGLSGSAGQGGPETQGGVYPLMSARQRRDAWSDAGPPRSPRVSAPLSASLFPFRHVVRQFARGDPLIGAPVRICDIVLEILAADAPEPPSLQPENREALQYE